jgi:hypothetical protein
MRKREIVQELTKFQCQDRQQMAVRQHIGSEDRFSGVSVVDSIFKLGGANVFWPYTLQSSLVISWSLKPLRCKNSPQAQSRKDSVLKDFSRLTRFFPRLYVHPHSSLRWDVRIDSLGCRLIQFVLGWNCLPRGGRTWTSPPHLLMTNYQRHESQSRDPAIIVPNFALNFQRFNHRHLKPFSRIFHCH